MLNGKLQLNALTEKLHKALSEKPNMNLTEFRHTFASLAKFDSWEQMMDAQTEDTQSPYEEEVVVKLKSTGVYDFSTIESKSPFDPKEVGILKPEMAILLAKFVYMSNLWFLAPFDEGVFESEDQALAYIEKFPNRPMSLVVSTNMGSSLSVIVNSEGHNFVYRKEDDLKVFEGVKHNSESRLIFQFTDFLSSLALIEFDDSDARIMPFIHKESLMTDYALSFSHLTSKHGTLGVEPAYSVFTQLQGGKSGYSVTRLDGIVLESDCQFSELYRLFRDHPLVIEAEMVGMEDKVRFIVNDSKDGGLTLVSMDDDWEDIPKYDIEVNDLLVQLPVVFEKFANDHYDTIDGQPWKVRL